MAKRKAMAMLAFGGAFGLTMALKDEVGGFWMRAAVCVLGGIFLAVLLMMATKRN